MFNKSSGQVWILAGARRSDVATNSVSTSTDMIHWENFNGTFTPRIGAVSGIDSNGNMFIGTGGETERRNYFFQDFWVSRDAMNWSSVCSACQFAERAYAQLSITRSPRLNVDILVLVGGVTGRTTINVLNDVWLSSDAAASWSCVTATASFFGRYAAIMDTTASNVLILSMGIDLTGENSWDSLNDLWLSYDGAVTWNKCNVILPTHSRYGAGWVFDPENHLMIFGGWDSLMDHNDVWRTIMPFNDTALLARWCIGNYDQTNIIIPTSPGLQCWPPTAACLNVTNTVITSSNSIQNEYSLILSLLQVDELVEGNRTVMKSARNSSNLYVWSSFLSDGQTNNFNLWSTSGNINTVFSSTSWSPSLVTNQPTSNTRYSQISSTYDYACALSTNGSIWCWGSTQWYVTWPRCSGKRCLMYGNLCESTLNCSSMTTTRAYSTFDPPTTYEPYIDMCLTGAYACAISSGTATNGSVICWMGIYGIGSMMVRWNDSIDGNTVNATCGSRANDVVVCPAPMSNDSNAFINERFTSIRCSQFSVCGVSMNGSVLCSTLPIGSNNETQDIISGQNDVPFVHIGQSNSNQVCGILSNGSIRCTASSADRLGHIDAQVPYDTVALAPRGSFRIGGGTHARTCDGGSFSDRIGSITSLCSGPCLAGYVGTTNSSDFPSQATCSRLCPRGNWCPSGSADAIPCQRGQYNVFLGMSASTQCALCKQGEYCPEGTISPYLCPRGAYCPDTTHYSPCPAGRYGDSFGLSNVTCSGECARGFMCSEYSVSARQQACPSGQYNNATGQPSCTLCSVGSFALLNENNGTVSCTACPAGSYSAVNGSSQCLQCASGHYTNVPGQEECIECLAGTYANDTGAQGCLPCPPGQFSSANGTSLCLPCPVGQFNNASRQSECIDCPAGTQSENIKSGDVRCIPCAVGFHSPTPGSKFCLPCSAATYNLLDRNVNCQQCTGIDGARCESGIARIDPSYHASVRVSRSSNGTISIALVTQRCSDGYCIGTNTTQLDSSAINEYAVSGRSETIYLSLLNQCMGRRDQSALSPLCSKCEPGFAPPDVGSPSTDCVRCEGMSWIKWPLLIGVSWLFVTVYYVAANGRLGLIGTLLYYFQTIAIMVSSQSSLTAWLRTFFSPVSIMPNYCLAQMTAELQYSIPLFIAPLQLMQLFIIVTVHALLKRYATRSTYKLDAETMTYHISTAESVRYSRDVRFPSLQWWSTLIRYRLWPELTVSTVCRSAFLIITASFTSVMVTSISWFDCTDDIDVGLSRISGSVVFAFPAISCQSASFSSWSFVMAGTIIIWLLVIALLSCWIVVNRHQLGALQQRSPLTTLSSTREQEPLDTLMPIALIPHTSDKQDLSLFVPFLQRTGFGCYWPTPVEDKDWDEPVCNVDECMETRREYAFRSVYGAVFDSFAPGATGWTVTILLRRLLLILLSVMLTAYPAIKYMSFTLLHLMILGLHSYYQPYTTARLNEMERIAIVVHIIVAVLLLTYDTTPNDQTVQSAILTVALIPLITYPLWHYTKTWFRPPLKSIQSTLDRERGTSTLFVNDMERRLLPEPIEMECKR